MKVREYRRDNNNGKSRDTGSIWYTRRRGNNNGKSRDTDNIWYTSRKKQQKQQTTKTNKKTIVVGHRYAQTNTNNVNETWVLLLEVKTILCLLFLIFFNIYFAIHSIAGKKSR